MTAASTARGARVNRPPVLFRLETRKNTGTESIRLPLLAMSNAPGGPPHAPQQRNAPPADLLNVRSARCSPRSASDLPRRIPLPMATLTPSTDILFPASGYVSSILHQSIVHFLTRLQLPPPLHYPAYPRAPFPSVTGDYLLRAVYHHPLNPFAFPPLDLHSRRPWDGEHEDGNANSKRRRASYPDYLRGFWHALADVRLCDNVLTLPHGLNWPGTELRTIFVRECYVALADAIFRDAKLPSARAVTADTRIPVKDSKRCWTVVGNPGARLRFADLPPIIAAADLHAGIGKTYFLNYLTWRLRQETAVKRVICELTRTVFLDLTNEEVFETKAELPIGPDPTRARWMLFDNTTDGPPIGTSPAVLVTSSGFVSVVLDGC